ncbi:hypothetical protein QC763_108788 [Podospora pseudopauciseta]|uniref:Complex 1 LYR protein domain-containing protein n=1 Tax=Podospora pseudopauciseta TaxID=2093780 RepID=A0ABR0HYB1_9PEZI|nr:hypothetical protein QC763_108788 [Podospora pseudopauciseta]
MVQQVNNVKSPCIIQLRYTQHLKMRLSGLQKEVLGLYRQCLRECRKKPEATRKHFQTFAREEFEKSISLDKRDFSAIEFLLRKGRRQLEMYASPGVKDIRK